ncbi:MAG: ATP-binding cassette domain-containing protein [Spirochaetaceae bacterium]|jgi:ABC-type bacteriocin/lantibiotic exporter with double-glycine peptidase domain|nr:ATP-binding cassette domain-containing protein [Spirochaetaceae bacterium]
MKLKRITTLITDNRSAVCYIFLLEFLMFIPAIITPIYTKVFTDSILSGGIYEWLFPLLAVMAYASLFSSGVTWLQESCLLRLSNKIELSSVASYMWRLFIADENFYYRQNSFALLSRKDASKLISETLAENMLSIFSAMTQTVLYFVLMVRMNLSMSLIVIMLILLDTGFGHIQSLAVRKIERKRRTGSPQELSPAGSENKEVSVRDLILHDEQLSATELQNIQSFKATASEPHIFKRMISSKIRIINASIKDDEAEAFEPFSKFSSVFFLNILLLISALRIMNRELSIGSYLVFQAYAEAFFSPMKSLLKTVGQIKNMEDHLEKRYRELGAGNEEPRGNKSETEEENQEQNETKNLTVTASPPHTRDTSSGKLKGRVEFRDVSFRYSNDSPFELKHFNLTLEPGQRATITGKSGSGKTTLIKLLQGFYAPCDGEVLIDGMRPQDISRSTFVRSIGCANQKICFFIASFKDNITLWDKEVSDHAVYEAANDAYIHDYIASLEGAYNHVLAENGHNLSGGQQQRIEIARALVYDPTVILLDESTSALGPAVSAKIEENLHKRGCTCLQMTHILSTVTGYDEIIVLDEGRVAARGTHSELMAASSLYADIYAEGRT